MQNKLQEITFRQNDHAFYETSVKMGVCGKKGMCPELILGITNLQETVD